MTAGLRGRVAVVTGASRGSDAASPAVSARRGRTVSVTGRTEQEGTSAARLPGSVHTTAREVTDLGGTGIAVASDAGDDEQLAALVARVSDEQGRLDVPFNPGPFWSSRRRTTTACRLGRHRRARAPAGVEPAGDPRRAGAALALRPSRRGRGRGPRRLRARRLLNYGASAVDAEVAKGEARSASPLTCRCSMLGWAVVASLKAALLSVLRACVGAGRVV